MLQTLSWFLAASKGDITILIYKRVKFHNLNQEKLKIIYLINKKINKPKFSFSCASNVKTPGKYQRCLNPITKKVYTMSSIT